MIVPMLLVSLMVLGGLVLAVAAVIHEQRTESLAE
jgi:hypothetical protein